MHICLALYAYRFHNCAERIGWTEHEIYCPQVEGRRLLQAHISFLDHFNRQNHTKNCAGFYFISHQFE